ncbi:DUF3180 domain-containing protein [Microbacterium karelineae]|uniref:DUF3180 domain-containing protein n=1 Tax=Microbacterium karelineae TaxID=2654283 RepID=UPI0012E9F8D6|nr:DUF3180 domain-containing protein [Microbacterium karelineae]
MRRTSSVTLVVCALLGAAAGFVTDVVLSGAGRATFSPSVMLPILLVALGACCLLFAWPIRRSVKDPRAPRVDPFRAVRIAVLAKSSSMVGAIVTGFAAGLLAFVLTRPVVPALGSMATEIATAIGGVVLVILALVAEHLCTLPKDPDERESDAAEPGTEPEY